MNSGELPDRMDVRKMCFWEIHITYSSGFNLYRAIVDFWGAFPKYAATEAV